MRLAIHILLLAVLLASCTKDEVVVPCKHDENGAQSVTKGSNSFNKDGVAEPDGSGSGSISDDGDDINDGEGRRKKKKP